ncbi:putative RNA-binding protein Luc7-like 1 isoform X1 [Saccoglossus kowalevskii]|uniref:RNA-binding protein Luc7-like 2-like isoform X2 n=1 Tax=Saccoglossus kowalevskii TaxID=10224 RepID=A0ABM0MRU7_SACKO|nr:PREDICTED: putative RNA-binding protein Luc7-like 2-like isoform X2 [Saccoglossus kowalevskii]
MSAQAQMRAMLDELMGTMRDGESKLTVKFSDPKVCKSFLLNCCPHDILASTRMDLGDCQKIHDLALRADYEKAARDKDYGYDIDAMEHLSAFIADCDRRTELAKKRLAETQEELSAEAESKAQAVQTLAEEIGKKLAEAEVLGAEGNVEESMKKLSEMEECRKKKLDAEEDYRNSMPASSFQQQKLRVCDVCSAYLGLHDNDRRLADHFGGKLHLGFISIRDKLDGLKKSVAEKREAREAERAKRREERELEREKERQKRKKDHEDKYRSRRSKSKSRERRRRSRSRSKSRDRRRRSRSRSKSRDRRRRSRSRSSDRRNRRHRSRSRDRRRRSHSREHRRSRDRSRERRHHRSKSRNKSKSRERSKERSSSHSKDRSSSQRSDSREKRHRKERSSDRSPKYARELSQEKNGEEPPSRKVQGDNSNSD